jgi:hypothetical protein
VAQSLNNLAVLRRAQGNYGQADLLYRRAVSIAEKALGARHPATELYRDNLQRCQAAMR